MAKKNFKSAVATVLGGKPAKSDNAQMHNCTDAQHPPDAARDTMPDVRLHCFISGDLDRSLETELADRKKNKQKFKGRLTKRAIIEEALVSFFG